MKISSLHSTDHRLESDFTCFMLDVDEVSSPSSVSPLTDNFEVEAIGSIRLNLFELLLVFAVFRNIYSEWLKEKNECTAFLS